jgi:hypothetical protein
MGRKAFRPHCSAALASGRAVHVSTAGGQRSASRPTGRAGWPAARLQCTWSSAHGDTLPGELSMGRKAFPPHCSTALVPRDAVRETTGGQQPIPPCRRQSWVEGGRTTPLVSSQGAPKMAGWNVPDQPAGY